MTKNHRGGLIGSASTTAGCIKDAVQVAAMRRYVSMLHPDLDRLFQRARAPAGMLVSENDECWFMRSPLSHNLLDGMMKGCRTQQVLLVFIQIIALGQRVECCTHEAEQC